MTFRSIDTSTLIKIAVWHSIILIKLRNIRMLLLQNKLPKRQNLKVLQQYVFTAGHIIAVKVLDVKIFEKWSALDL